MILGVIPARGGSKRLPRKNLRQIGGKTLVAWAIESAQAATRLDKIVVSTDDEEIIREAQRYHVEWILRLPALAQDTTPMIEVLQHAATFHPQAQLIVTLQPTVPFRTGTLIDGVVGWLQSHHDSAVTVDLAHHPTGEVYVSRFDLITLAGRILGPQCVDYIREGTTVNIDTEYDLVRAERYYAHLRHR